MTIPKDIARAWSDVLMRMAQSWVFNCDGGCFLDVCTRRAWTVGELLVIYQPHKSMQEYEDYVATVFMKRIDKGKITAAQVRDANLDEVNAALLQSYNDVLDKTGGKWTTEIDGSLDELLQTRKPLAIEKGCLKYTFEIRGPTDGCCGNIWWPSRLAEWRGDERAYPEGADEFVQKCTRNALRANV